MLITGNGSPQRAVFLNAGMNIKHQGTKKSNGSSLSGKSGHSENGILKLKANTAKNQRMSKESFMIKRPAEIIKPSKAPIIRLKRTNSDDTPSKISPNNIEVVDSGTKNGKKLLSLKKIPSKNYHQNFLDLDAVRREKKDQEA